MLRNLFRLFIAIFGAIFGFCSLLIFVSITVAIVRSTVFSSEGGFSRGNEVGVLELGGVLYDAIPFVTDLRRLREDESIKAIVVRVDSPGGLVGPSQEIYEAIKKTDQTKPVLVSIGSVGASGGYYAALGGRKIYANAGALTGSIGVIMEFVNTQELLKWAKIKRYALKSGRFKDVGATFRTMRPDERQLLQQMISNIQAQFRLAVSERRKLKGPALETVTDGRILTGAQAKAANLIDQIGGFEETLAEAKRVADLPANAAVRYPDNKTGLLRELLFGETETRTPLTLERWTQTLERLTSKPITGGWSILLLAPIN